MLVGITHAICRRQTRFPPHVLKSAPGSLSTGLMSPHVIDLLISGFKIKRPQGIVVVLLNLDLMRVHLKLICVRLDCNKIHSINDTTYVFVSCCRH